MTYLSFISMGSVFGKIRTWFASCRDSSGIDMPGVGHSDCRSCHRISRRGCDDIRALRMKDFLMGIYDCGVPFTLAVVDRKPAGYMGLYYVSDKLIVLYAGWFTSESQMLETAIHEYAHHIVYTHMGHVKGKVHDKRFWQVYTALCCKALRQGRDLTLSVPLVRDIMQ